MTDRVSKIIKQAKKNIQKLEQFFIKKFPITRESSNDDILISFVIKSLKRYKSIIKLCQIGLEEDAMILNRSLWETTVTSYWLFYKKTQQIKRCKLFKNLGDEQDYLLLTQLKMKKRFMNLKRRYLRLKQKYGVDRNGKFKNFPWRSIYQRAREKYIIDGKTQTFEQYYKKFYPFLSLFTHPSWNAVTTSFETDKINKNLNIKMKPGFEFVPETILLATAFSVYILKLFSKKYNFNFKQQDAENIIQKTVSITGIQIPSST